ncbi:MAG: PEP-CTERM sorting domain-containing protein [Alphaproteobacteria bacterium]|nr:PEP-CTERM sorting domain-containing protein [Alphaproteobacteria bacterium]
MTKPCTKLLFLLASAVLVFAVPANATTIFEYSGSGDPTAQGWSEGVGAGGGTSAGPVGGESAWFVEDSSTAGASTLTYGQNPTAGNNVDAATNGWSLTTRLKMITGTVGIHNSIFTDYIDGSTQWVMDFDVAPDGDPVVYLGFGAGRPSFEVDGGAGQYHTYSLVFDPIAGSADLFVDGIERISDHGGIAAAASRVAWGAGASNATGRANFESVTFDINAAEIPEPGALAIYGLGLVGLGFARRRTR